MCMCMCFVSIRGQIAVGLTHICKSGALCLLGDRVDFTSIILQIFA
jgi:hypothetical protein